MVITRQVAIPILANVTVALVTSRIRGIPTEVPVGQGEGLDHDSVVNCDNLVTISKTGLLRFRGRLGASKIRQMNAALRIALELD